MNMEWFETLSKVVAIKKSFAERETYPDMTSAGIALDFDTLDRLMAIVEGGEKGCGMRCILCHEALWFDGPQMNLLRGCKPTCPYHNDWKP